MGNPIHCKKYDEHFPLQLMFLMVSSDDDEVVTEVCEVLQEEIKKRFSQYGTAILFGFSGLNC